MTIEAFFNLSFGYYCALISLSFYGLYFLIGSLCYYLPYQLKKTAWSKFKIQPAFPSDSNLKSEIRYAIGALFIFSLFGVLTLALFKNNLTLLYTDFEAYSIFYAIGSFFLYFLLHDLYFYWTHRILHANSFLAKAHSVHHKSHNPSPFSSYAFHPIEAIIQAAALPLICLVLPIHTHILIATQVYTVAVNIIGHMGYEYHPRWFHDSWFGKMCTCSTHHNAHHEFYHDNYGLHFVIWDKLFNTYNAQADSNFDAIKARTSSKNKLDK